MWAWVANYERLHDPASIPFVRLTTVAGEAVGRQSAAPPAPPISGNVRRPPDDL
jgi:hypothetical protein